MVGANYVPQLYFSVLTNCVIFGTLLLGEVVETVEYGVMRYRSDIGK